ncbi:MAG TPA: hypothetical protein VMZ69_01740 [Saprospiraceae bacterium]|nr:hypothetical protein [Saprospiraceae bacterium]
MKTCIIILFSLLAFDAFSQVKSVWRGNTPGREKDWNAETNWSNNRIPDEFTDVVIELDISVKRNYPVLVTDKTEINSLNIWPGATLTIKEGQLLVLDLWKTNFNRFQVIGKGKLIRSDDPHYVIDETASKN